MIGCSQWLDAAKSACSNICHVYLKELALSKRQNKYCVVKTVQKVGKTATSIWWFLGRKEE